MEVDVSLFLNYGIAGVILLVFYLLMKNELSSLRDTIRQLSEVQQRLAIRIEVLLSKFERS